MKKIISAAAILLLLSLQSLAQDAQTRQQLQFSTALDSFIQKAMKMIPDVPAIAVVVIKDDRPVFLKAYGIADKAANTRADIHTLFNISSSTKSFTALAAALLDKDGVIKLEDPIIKYTAGLNFRNPIPERIRIIDLLTHTSGIRNNPLTHRFAHSGETAKPGILTVLETKTNVIDSNYGKYLYDNLGYNFYALLLENHTGQKWQDVVEQKIFKPLQMDHSTAYYSKALAKKWTIGKPYLFSGEAGETVLSPAVRSDGNTHSAGGIFASISDIGRWLNMNMNNGRLDGKQVIPATIINKAHSPYTKTTREQPPFPGDGEYGLGWQIGEYKNNKVIYHHGGYYGHRSHISFLPEKKLGVSVQVNESSVGGRLGHMIATYAYEWWLGSPELEQNYNKQLTELAGSVTRGKNAALASVAGRATRVSQLTQPLHHYTGKYYNDAYGTMEVIEINNNLSVRMGGLNTVSTPFTEKETIRVELIPGSGDVIRFKLDGELRAEGLNFAGINFVKVK